MTDQITIMNVSLGDTRTWKLPFNGVFLGVYSDHPIDVDVVTTDEQAAHMYEGVQWEPFGGFAPANVTALQITPTTEAARVVIRWSLHD